MAIYDIFPIIYTMPTNIMKFDECLSTMYSGRFSNVNIMGWEQI